MQQTIKKWGNGAAIRLPAAIMELADLSLNVVVNVHAERGRIVIEPAQPQHFDLDNLLSGVTSKNRHELADFGEPVDREIW